MEPKSLRGNFETIVLMAVYEIGNDAYGVPVRRKVEEKIGKLVSVGAHYTTLNRLEEKGFVSSWEGEATPERGGRAKRYFKIEGSGLTALEDMQRNIDRAFGNVGALKPAEGTA